MELSCPKCGKGIEVGDPWWNISKAYPCCGKTLRIAADENWDDGTITFWLEGEDE